MAYIQSNFAIEYFIKLIGFELKCCQNVSTVYNYLFDPF